MKRLPVWRTFLCFICITLSSAVFMQTALSNIFVAEKFTENDAILIVDDVGHVLYEWRAEELMVPASLVKIITSYLAIEKWGLAYQFKTEFYQDGSKLWIKGYGDPYLVSEELDRIVLKLLEYDLTAVTSIYIDNDYFSTQSVPGSSSANDPYNAPVSAVSINFNTVSFKKQNGDLVSGEMQTPLTGLAKKLVNNQAVNSSGNKATRINLIDANNAQQQFAEVLAHKLGWGDVEIRIQRTMPETATLLFKHENSNTLESVLTGAMKYSNNFIANQVFIKLAEGQGLPPLDFVKSTAYTQSNLVEKFAWSEFDLKDGAGLSRNNKLSAKQVDDVLRNLSAYHYLFNNVVFENQPDISAYVKTGTLNGVSNYAGYLNFPNKQYRFVFMFNRTMPYRYRNKLLERLIQELSLLEKV